MKMYVGTEWSDRPRTSPSSILSTARKSTPCLGVTLTTWALPSPLPHGGPKRWPVCPVYERYLILRRAALKDSGMGKKGPSYALQ